MTLKTIREHLLAIKGPLGTPVGKRPPVTERRIASGTRFVCLCSSSSVFQGVPSPLKHPEKTDITIFRENTEDIYAGIEWDAGTEEVATVISFLQEKMEWLKSVFQSHQVSV
jgi:isocitrate dehydrogenase